MTPAPDEMGRLLGARDLHVIAANANRKTMTPALRKVAGRYETR